MENRNFCLDDIASYEDIPQYLNRLIQINPHLSLEFLNLTKLVVGYAGPFKEGDKKIGVGTENKQEKQNAQVLVGNTKIQFFQVNPLHCDQQQELIWKNININSFEQIKNWSILELKNYLLAETEINIKKIMDGLNSDVIASVVKIMTNSELINVGQKIFNPLDGSNIGAKGYLSARVQPNSPTDSPEDIRWQVFNAWSFGVGDLMLGNNPVSSLPNSVLNLEITLKELIEIFNLSEVLPWCVLAHVDIQAQLEKDNPKSTALWFQSIAGTISANEVFDISIEKMIQYAQSRNELFGMYFETGQGADFTNSQDHGVDMGTLESRKYGLAKVLQMHMPKNASGKIPWMPVNDVAGFIGPEVFRTKEQLVRVALEDTVMGKLHGLTIGLDICSTFHMSVNPQDISWAIDQIMPVNPAFIMALPTSQDPMLSYLSTGIHHHLHIREKFGFKINEAMMTFFQEINIYDANGLPTAHFGDPTWVYVKFQQKKGDTRNWKIIYEEGTKLFNEAVKRGIILVRTPGNWSSKIPEEISNYINNLYKNAKISLQAELGTTFTDQIPNKINVRSQSKNRDDYILHPSTGEELAVESILKMTEIKKLNDKELTNLQIIISDGLNANALADEGHAVPCIQKLRNYFEKDCTEFKLATNEIIVNNGRVRTGYQIGKLLFANKVGTEIKSIIHIIGERPGTEHNNFSIYITSAFEHEWASVDCIDHDITSVISGISNTAITPELAVEQAIDLLLNKIAILRNK
ncbi:MAG: ethanolamine ammonia-lyase subunit EutB [Bacteriovorax sp.]|nr:ethanolamine ammonia-lyase subunit EutB [Bacteriovorax sp.]